MKTKSFIFSLLLTSALQALCFWGCNRTYRYECPVLPDYVFPFVFSFCCQTGAFGVTNPSSCIGENWLRNMPGAVTFFGASVDADGPRNQIIAEKVFGDAIHDKYIGSQVTQGMRRYYTRFVSFFSISGEMERHVKAYNLLGDPSINKWGYDEWLTIPEIEESATIELKNKNNIPVSWSCTGAFRLSNPTNQSVIITRNPGGSGTITARFEGLGTITRNVSAPIASISGPKSFCSSSSVTFSGKDKPANSYWVSSSNLSMAENVTGNSISVGATTATGTGWLALCYSQSGNEIVRKNIQWGHNTDGK